MKCLIEVAVIHMYMFYFIINYSLSRTQMEQVISPFPSAIPPSSCYNFLWKNLSPCSLSMVFIFSGFCVIKILEGKEVGRRKRSIECDPGHGWLCPQAEESRQTSPLPQNFRSSQVRKGIKFVTISLGSHHKVYLHF